ncbi:sterigmatocystin 8-O-methyltransferase [Hypoxylon sp. FL1284]|nr:sterigmatocystin 8-O-methyltransferase [Hypoxylon sp. FL1284]
MDRVADSRIVQLPRTISESVSQLDEALLKQNLPSPSFDENSPLTPLPASVWDFQNAVLDATSELHDLLLEPVYLVKAYAASNNSLCIQAIVRFGIANMVVPDGRLSFAEIGKKTKLGETMIARLLRHAMTMRIFCEPHPGTVAHTRASRLLADPYMSALMSVGTEDMWPAATRVCEMLSDYLDSVSRHHLTFSGFALSQNSSKSIYEMLSDSPERADRFAQAMIVWSTRPDYAPSHAVEGYDWGAVPSSSEDGRVKAVDVGGARGHVAAVLAQHYPKVDVLVQDMAKVIEGADLDVAQSLVREGRVRFMAHDLFAPQAVLHNWADKYCLAILRAQIPALCSGARLIVMETCMPDAGQDDVGNVPMWLEKDFRSEDLTMGAVFNSRERTLREWKALFSQADSRLVLKQVIKPKGSALSIMEVVLAAS